MGKIFASHQSGYTTEFYYGVEKGGSVNHLEFYGVENFRCNGRVIDMILGRTNWDNY